MGKPGWGNAQSRESEPTQGTETSKYLQERKSTETPSVVASERGIAQTVPGFWGGVVGPRRGTAEIRRRGWKASAQRVTLPYLKIKADLWSS